MNNTPGKNLSRKKMQQLLASIGSKTTEDTSQIEAVEYNWHDPHYFSSEQLKRLDDFTGKAAAALSEKFTTLCNSDFNVAVVSITQHFANKFLEKLSEDKQNGYYLAFGTDKSCPFGLVIIPAKTAIIWISYLLGDSESEADSGKDLSPLEKSLLLDIVSNFVEAISDCSGSRDFSPAGDIVKGQFPIKVQDTEELSQITFRIEKTGSGKSSEAHLLIPCSRLESVVGKIAHVDKQSSAQAVSKAILGHLQEIPVSVTVKLASISLSLEEIMSLQTNDILLLDKTVDEPVELIVEGRTFYYGRPAKSAGKYAVVITEPSRNKT